MGIKKCLLPLTWIKPYKVLAGIFAPHAEKLQTNRITGQDYRRRTPISLSFITSLRVARNKGAGRIDPQSHLRKSNIAANSGLASRITLLFHQTIIHPTRRMPLLLWLLLVTRKPSIDNRQVLLQNRKRLMRSLFVTPWLST